MSRVDRVLCRRAAAECIQLARITHDPHTKEILLTRGQEWLKLAYSEHDAEFERLLALFNSEQMGSHGSEHAPMQQQPLQQQQSRLRRI
jgi:hypothetical protein